MNHTPGPWIAAGSEMTTATWVNDFKGRRICQMAKRDTDFDNAKLIAAAPELLKALQSIVNLMANYPESTGDECADIARAALAKVENA